MFGFPTTAAAWQAGTRVGAGFLGWFLTCTIAVAGAVVSHGCGVTHLVPAEPSRAAGVGSGAGFVEASGLRLIARANAWDGPGRLPRDVVALALELHNMSGQTIYEKRADIALVGEGRSLSAMDPGSVRGRGLRTTVGTRAIGRGRTGQDDMVNPRPAVPEDDADSQEALYRAFPEGAIKPGASVQGFVYFAKPEGMSRCDLVMVVRRARSGPELTTLRSPFRVER